MSDSPEQPSDEELSELIDIEEYTVDSEFGELKGAVEVGIPPAIDDVGGIDSSEEKFSTDDFDLSEQAVEHSIEENIPSDESTSKELAPIEESSFAKESSSESSSKETVEDIPETNGVGGVAEFRKTLSNLSRQLEIDRLAFLHQSMKDCGEKLPTLSQIAADIQGTKPLAAQGDCDQYGGRPTARLEGWVSGLSFGANRRAKKFNK